MRTKFVSIALLAAIGCGGGPTGPEARVSGTVTFKNQPVALGRVYFDVDQVKQPGGQQGYSDIKDGRFDTAAGGKPPSPGAVKVRVEGLTPPGADGLHGLLFRQYEFAADLAPGDNEKAIEVPAVQGERMPKNTGPPP